MKILNPTLVPFTEHMDAPDPARLISECIAGDEAAIETLIRQHEMGVFRLALSVVGDAAEANEITQETFIAALRALPKYQEQRSFKSWLFTIALNLSRSHLRKRKFLAKLKETTTALFRLETGRQALPEETVIKNEKEAALWDELNKLDERHRIVVILRYFQELSTAEIAEVLSLHEGTVHSRLHTARERLRSALFDLQGD
jgi:RNA polymerase sigma-70 factor (ECF subfamily)